MRKPPLLSSPHRRGPRPALLDWIPACAGMTLVFIAIAGCGFHLRGLERHQLPAFLRTLKIDAVAVSGDMARALRQQLMNYAGVDVVEQGRVPRLMLSGEQSRTRAITVDSTGKASAYLLEYEVTFELRDADGRVLIKPGRIISQESYRFDPRDILAKEYEQKTLQQYMFREAARRIATQLSSYAPEAKDAAQ